MSLQIALIGPWIPKNLNDDDLEIQILRDAAVLTAPPAPTDLQTILIASMVAPGNTPDEMPRFASLVVSHGPAHRTLSVQLVHGNLIVPSRYETTRIIEWPGGVGPVQIRQLSYLIPTPDGTEYYILVFSTPNLAQLDEMEFLFESIVASTGFVDDPTH